MKMIKVKNFCGKYNMGSSPTKLLYKKMNKMSKILDSAIVPFRDEDTFVATENPAIYSKDSCYVYTYEIPLKTLCALAYDCLIPETRGWQIAFVTDSRVYFTSNSKKFCLSRLGFIQMIDGNDTDKILKRLEEGENIKRYKIVCNRGTFKVEGIDFFLTDHESIHENKYTFESTRVICRVSDHHEASLRKQEVEMHSKSLEANRRLYEEAKKNGELRDVGVLSIERDSIQAELARILAKPDPIDESFSRSLTVKLKPGMNLVAGTVVQLLR